MNIKLLILIVLHTNIIFCNIEDNFPKWKYKSFGQAMRKSESNFERAKLLTKQIVLIDGQILYNFFDDLYEKNEPSKVHTAQTAKIPKIMHGIWINGDIEDQSAPEEYREFMQSWVKHHVGPEWQYWLWTDKEIAELGLKNQAYYDQIENRGAKADIARYEIVYRYGGVYIDMDYECLQPLDMFHHKYDFYTALQPLDSQFIQLGLALFGAIPGHPILKHCIEHIQHSWQFKGAPKKTGPVHFTKSFYAVADKTEGLIDIAFPAFYFYPLACTDRFVNKQQWIYEGAYAVHWWSKSWMPKHFRPKAYQTIDNNNSTLSWND